MKIMPVTMPKDVDEYFFNRVKDIDFLNMQISSLRFNVPPLLLITGYRGVGKTFLLRKVLNNQNEDILTAFIDLSEIVGRQKGNLSEEKVLKEILDSITIAVSKDKNFHERFINKMNSNIKKLKLKNYDFTSSGHIFEIPLPVISDNYDKLSKFVMKLPQYIIDSSDKYKGFFNCY